VTFDAVDAKGSHLGGLIFPSARLAASALDRSTRNIGRTAAAPAVAHGIGLLGRDTDAAVGKAAWLALSAALDRAVAAVAGSLGTRPEVYLTGGDAEALRGWLETDVELRADLVLEGLKLFADGGPAES
jgi:type III pantothenate kinase